MHKTCLHWHVHRHDYDVLSIKTVQTGVYRFAELACDAAFLAGRVPAQHMLPSEAWANRALLKWVVDLQAQRMQNASVQSDRESAADFWQAWPCDKRSRITNSAEQLNPMGNPFGQTRESH